MLLWFVCKYLISPLVPYRTLKLNRQYKVRRMPNRIESRANGTKLCLLFQPCEADPELAALRPVTTELQKCIGEEAATCIAGPH